MAKRKSEIEQPAEPTADEGVAIELVPGRPIRGVFPVKLMQGEKVLLAGQVNPHKAQQIEAFVKSAKKKFRALDGDDIREQLLQLAAPQSPTAGGKRPLAFDYEATETGIIWHRERGEQSIDIPLTNFTATITADVLRDDGAEQARMMEISAMLKGRPSTFTIPAGQFAAMDWPIRCMGAGAIVHPGMGTKDHARAAIQTLSPEAASKTIYTHTGWRLIGNRWVYLHAGGGIGADGPVEGVSVELAGALEHYRLSDPPMGESLRQAIRASLAILDLADDIQTIPIYCAIWRAVLGDCDFSPALAGPTGVQKSELAALVQQHFGTGMDRTHLPGSWRSTPNALEGLLFGAKDAITVVDDFAPTGLAHDVARLHMAADHILRGQGNGAGRQRMNADGSLRPAKPPRGLAFPTGEDVPRGQSLRARMMIVEIAKGDIDLSKLTCCQQDARKGLYAAAMAGFVRFMAGRYADTRAGLKDEIEGLRGQAVGATAHCRTPEIVANLAIGLRWFTAYALDAGAMDRHEADQLWNRGWAALMAAADRQTQHQQAEEPTRRFIELLQSAIASGAAHLADRDGNRPANAESWGWRSSTGMDQTAWTCQGSRIGWIDGADVYLDPDASCKAAQLAIGDGSGLAITASTLRKRLAEKGMILRAGGRDELTVRRMLAGSQHKVLHLAPGVLRANPGEPDDGEPDGSGIGQKWRVPLAENGPIPTPEPPNEPPKNCDSRPKMEGDSGNGGNGGFEIGDTPAGDFHMNNDNGSAKPTGRKVRVRI